MNRKQKKLLFRILLSLTLIVILQFFKTDRYISLVLHLVPYIIVGYDVLIGALHGIIHGRVLDEKFLMAVATIGAFVLGAIYSGDYIEAVAVMLFYQAGELFSSCAVSKSRKNIKNLLDICPDIVNVERDGEIISVNPDEIEIGETIIVYPGERIAIDGVVIDGSSSINTSAITGESMPVYVSVGDAVYSGCINTTSPLNIRTEKQFSESTATRVLELVENASGNKSRAEGFVSRFAKYYTPSVCVTTLLLATLAPAVSYLLGYGANISVWLYRALSFLVASCPCALVISIPLSFFCALGGACKGGVLIKGSNYLEALASTQTFVFDKTGTLTEGELELGEIVTFGGGISEGELLRVAAHAESASLHPISRCIVASFGGRIDRERVSDITEHGGMGISATFDGRRVLIGNKKLLSSSGINTENATDKDGASITVFVAIDGEYKGRISLNDKIKSTSASALDALRALGAKKTVILTGDREDVARSVASETGADEVFASCLPEDKVRVLETLMQEGVDGGKNTRKKRRPVAFVGDGINDAPVIARADVGIAMGAMGSDAAIEAADVVIMDDDPSKLAFAVRLSRKCMKIVRQNTSFAIAVKLVSLVLLSTGLSGMWLAVFADVGVTAIVVLNSARCCALRK